MTRPTASESAMTFRSLGVCRDQLSVALADIETLRADLALREKAYAALSDTHAELARDAALILALEGHLKGSMWQPC